MARFLAKAKTKVTRAKCWLTAKQVSYLRSVVVGGQWEQARRAEAIMVKDDRCKLCGGASGTLTHRHFQCDGTFALRYHTMPDRTKRIVGKGAARIRSLAERALMPYDGLPVAKKPPPEVEWKTNCMTGCGSMSGEIFGDGSVVGAEEPKFATAAFAVVQCDRTSSGATRKTAEYVSSFSHFVQNGINGPELEAFRFYLYHATAGSTYHSDSEYVVNGGFRAREIGMLQLEREVRGDLGRCVEAH